MKIFAGGVATETNTFSPLPTGTADFFAQRGKDTQAGRIEHASLDLTLVWGRQAQAAGHQLTYGLMAWAAPSGTTVRSTYEALRDELLDDLRKALPVDVVLLNLHGAMVAQGYDDCEEDMIRRVREIAGPDAVVGVLLDLHCHLSQALLAPADIVITYKEYPHTDTNNRMAELFELAVGAKQGKIRPTMALFDCRMSGMYPTTREPLRSFVDAMSAAEGKGKVLSVSFGHGFQFADIPHVGAKVIAISDGDPALAQQTARDFGRRAYEIRAQIGFESISVSMDEALTRALASPKKPVVVADQADNVGGGAPGDATSVLRWLLDHQAKNVAIAILHDPEVVKTAKRVGVGARIAVRLGGKTSPASGTPVDLEVTVVALKDKYMHPFPQESGEPTWFAVGDVAVLRHGSIDIVVGSERCQCFDPSIFSDFGIDPNSKQVLIPKSYHHFYGAFAPLAAEVIYMAAPGAVQPDPRRNQYRRFDTTRLYPWVKDSLP